MKRPNPEYNAGEADCRERILAHLDVRYSKFNPLNESEVKARDEVRKLQRWIKAMPKRSAKKPGGAGRK